MQRLARLGRRFVLVLVHRALGARQRACAPDDLERCCGCDALQLESAKELQLYLRVSFYALSEAREIALRAEVERLYRRLVAPHADLPA